MTKFKKYDTNFSERLLQYVPVDERYSCTTFMDFKNMPIDENLKNEMERRANSTSEQMTPEMMFKLLVITINGLHERLIQLESHEFRRED